MKIRIAEKCLCMLALAACGCSGGDDFRVIGTVDNLGTQNLRVVYYTDKALQSLTTTAIDGQFQFSGSAPKETLLEIFTTDRVPLASLIVKNGESVKLKIDRNKPWDWKIEGSEKSQRLADFVRKNAGALDGGTADDVNDVVDGYVGANPEDMVSTVVLLKYYDAVGHESACDSLFELISHDARPDYMCDGVRAIIKDDAAYDMEVALMPMNLYTKADSLTIYRPDAYKGTVMAFSDAGQADRKELRTVLRGLRKDYKKKDVAIIELNMAEDTTEWQKTVATDSATWVQAWIPGSVASPAVRSLRVPRMPYYIVADSVGRLLYRGASAGTAEEVMKGYL